MIWRITLSYACYGVISSQNGRITQVPPIAAWMTDKKVDYIRRWVARKGGEMEKLNE